ncbi:hypothetical protein [Microbulbifer variabilis]|uniref:hypothetical protein n=1 Tax=Microbulbifer variabilis TaxID=266805 RepID=UPI001CFCB317|nr:hypothetical protein [Microbulbifer variabilis]
MKKIIILLALFLSGCANYTHLIKNLEPIESDNSIVLESQLTYEAKYGLAKVNWKEGLERGIYRPEFENEFGTFYRGPEACVIQYMEKLSMGPFEGGIWIPKDKVNNSPRLYYYFNYNKSNAQAAGGLVVSAILAGSKGDLTMMPVITSTEFLDKIKISNLD